MHFCSIQSHGHTSKITTHTKSKSVSTKLRDVIYFTRKPKRATKTGRRDTYKEGIAELQQDINSIISLRRTREQTNPPKTMGNFQRGI